MQSFDSASVDLDSPSTTEYNKLFRDIEGAISQILR